MSDEIDDADDQERAEAAALAAALDGEPHDRKVPEDALAAALLVRHGGARGELTQERSEAILSELLRDARAGAGKGAQAERGARRGEKVVRLWPRLAVLAAAAAALIGVLGTWATLDEPATSLLVSAPVAPAAIPASPAPRAVAVLPKASAQLLAAHSAWLRTGLDRGGTSASPSGAGEPEAAERFERELRAYRVQLLRALQAEYPVKLGMLEDSPRRAR